MVSVALADWNAASSSNPTSKVTLSGPSSSMSSMMVMVAVPPRSISTGLMVQSSVSVAPRFVGMSGVILSFTPGGSVTGLPSDARSELVTVRVTSSPASSSMRRFWPAVRPVLDSSALRFSVSLSRIVTG